MPRRPTPSTTNRRPADDPLVNLNARVPEKLLARVRAQCLRADVSLREFITGALQQHLSARAGRRRVR
jgi:predicted HicB family RNase H-like nuclease